MRTRALELGACPSGSFRRRSCRSQRATARPCGPCEACRGCCWRASQRSERSRCRRPFWRLSPALVLPVLWRRSWRSWASGKRPWPPALVRCASWSSGSRQCFRHDREH
ncbi:unnamed protein product [Symbiodinium microadriaticum]|nr:unnamed protein product [Symbiodinium microadriaticum]